MVSRLFSCSLTAAAVRVRRGACIRFSSAFVREKRENRLRTRGKKEPQERVKRTIRNRRGSIIYQRRILSGDRKNRIFVPVEVFVVRCFFLSLCLPGFVVLQTNLFRLRLNFRFVCCVTCYMSTTLRRSGTTDLRLLARTCNDVKHVDADLVMAERRGCHAASRAIQNH